MSAPYYQDDHVTIYHGDCRDALHGVSADSIVTDPPFKLSQTYSANADADNLDAVASLKDTASIIMDAVPDGAAAAVIYDNRLMPFGIDAMRRAGWRYLRMLAFYRRWGNAHQLNGWMSTTDPILVFAKPGAKPTFYGSWRHDCYIRSSPEATDHGHPAQKPLEMMSHLVERLTPPGGTVLDPYAGSGSTLVAAHATGRRAIGIEFEERYCEIAAKRCAQEVLDFGGAA